MPIVEGFCFCLYGIQGLRRQICLLIKWQDGFLDNLVGRRGHTDFTSGQLENFEDHAAVRWSVSRTRVFLGIDQEETPFFWFWLLQSEKQWHRD